MKTLKAVNDAVAGTSTGLGKDIEDSTDHSDRSAGWRRFGKLAAVALAAFAMMAVIACSGDSDPEDRQFSLTIEDGKLTSESTSFEVKQGDSVTLRLDSDEEGSVHLHGYDVKVGVMPGMESKLEFVADATGKFNFEFHHGEMESEGHSHDDDVDELCKAEIPDGAPTPSFTIEASPGSIPGQIRVAVDLVDFVLEPAPAGTTVATGHWHLDVDGVEIAMYEEPEITEMLEAAGEYELVATLYDVEHCSYGITAMTTLMLPEGSEHQEEAREEGGEEHDDVEEGVVLGAVEVYPR